MNQRSANAMNEDPVFDMAKRVFAAQPFTVLLGAELVEAGAGFATIALPLRDDLKQQHGFAHGGVVSYLADNALTFAGGLALGGDALTSEFKINYVKPASGDRLIAKATSRSTGRNQAVCQCDIFFEDREEEPILCAVAQGTIVALKR